jgi:hypothetical protein
MAENRYKRPMGKGGVIPKEFEYLNQDNFIITIDRLNFGLMGGLLFTNGKFSSIEEQIAYVQSELLFSRGMAERLSRYLEILERKKQPA